MANWPSRARICAEMLTTGKSSHGGQRMSWAANFFAGAIEALSRKSDASRGSLTTVARSILRYPIKTVAAFLMAPILAARVACVAKDPLRRVIAGVGLVLAVVAASVVGMVAGGLVATTLGFFGVLEWFGVSAAIGYLLFGVAVGVPMSVVLSAVTLNATAWLFLHMSSEDVVAHLRSLSE